MSAMLATLSLVLICLFDFRGFWFGGLGGVRGAAKGAAADARRCRGRSVRFGRPVRCLTVAKNWSHVSDSGTGTATFRLGLLSRTYTNTSREASCCLWRAGVVFGGAGEDEEGKRRGLMPRLLLVVSALGCAREANKDTAPKLKTDPRRPIDAKTPRGHIARAGRERKSKGKEREREKAPLCVSRCFWQLGGGPRRSVVCGESEVAC